MAVQRKRDALARRQEAARKGALTRRRKREASAQAKERIVQEKRLAKVFEAVELEAAGASYRKIGKILGEPYQTVHHWCKQFHRNAAEIEDIEAVRNEQRHRCRWVIRELADELEYVRGLTEMPDIAPEDHEPIGPMARAHLALDVIREIRNVVELEARVSGLLAAGATSVNIGTAAGASFQAEFVIPKEPAQIERYLELLDAADAIAADFTPIEDD